MVYTKHLLSVKPLITLTRSWKLQNIVFTLFTLAVNIYMLAVSRITEGGYITPNKNWTYLTYNTLLDEYASLI